MNYSAIEARINRSQLKQLAGNFYQDKNSLIIQQFEKDGCSVLFGIKKNDSTYTLVGEKKVYYSSEEGKKSQLDLVRFTNLLRKNARLLRKKGNFEYLHIGESDSIWMHNGSTMSSIWNVILFINEINEKESSVPPQK